MIYLLIGLISIMPALAVLRRAGYVWNERMFRGHEFQRICKVCNPDCLGCGMGRHYHHDDGSRFGCSHGYSPSQGIVTFHLSALIIALPFALAWPLTMLCFGVYAVNKRQGKEINFLKPPPTIESRAEKNERRLRAAEAEIEETNKRLQELGIEL